MTFSSIHGNESLKAALAGMVDSGRIPHAIMLHEEDGGGAVSIAIAFLQYLYCTNRSSGDACAACPSCNRISKLIHPDVHFIFPVLTGDSSRATYDAWRKLVLENPRFTENNLRDALGIEGKSSLIAVAEAKALLDTLSLSALEGGYRSVVVYLPEKMNQEAANRLLKMIEEPPSQTEFLLVTHSPEKVLQTIRSRCQLLRVDPVELPVLQDESGLFAPLMDALCAKDLLSALQIGENLAALPSRMAAKDFCKYAAARCRDIFLVQQGLQALAGGVDVSSWASRCRKSFPRRALAAFDRFAQMIDRNVNVKILFTELVDTLMENV